MAEGNVFQATGLAKENFLFADFDADSCDIGRAISIGMRP